MGNFNINTKVEQNQSHDKLNTFCKTCFIKLNKGYTCYFNGICAELCLKSWFGFLVILPSQDDFESVCPETKSKQLLPKVVQQHSSK